VLSKELNLILLVSGLYRSELPDHLTSELYAELFDKNIERTYIVSATKQSQDRSDALSNLFKSNLYPKDDRVNTDYLTVNTQPTEAIAEIFQISSSESKSVLILSDTLVFDSDFMSELLSLSNEDDKFGFISPRCNSNVLTAFTTEFYRRETIFKKPKTYLGINALTDLQRDLLGRYQRVPILPIGNIFVSHEVLKFCSNYINQFKKDKNWINFVMNCSSLGFLSLIDNTVELSDTLPKDSLIDEFDLNESFFKMGNETSLILLQRFINAFKNRFTQLTLATQCYKVPKQTIRNE
jgi:hypothetical protein